MSETYWNPANPNIAEFFEDEYLRRRRSTRRSRVFARNAVWQFQRFQRHHGLPVALREIETDHVDSWIKSIHRRYSIATASAKRSAVLAVLRFAGEIGCRDSIDRRAPVRPRRRKDPTPAEIASRAAEIRRGWDVATRAKRMVGIA